MMNKIRNLKVGKKFVMSFGIVIGLIALMLIASVLCIMQINNKMTEFYEGPYVYSTLQSDIRGNIEASGKELLWATTTDDMTETQAHVSNSDSYSQNVMTQVAQMKTLIANDTLMAKFESAIASVRELRASVGSYANENMNEQALAVYNGEYKSAIENVESILTEIGEYADTQAANNYGNAKSTGTFATVLMIVLGIASVLCAVAFAMMITRAIKEPVEQIGEAAQKLKKGELDVDIPYTSEDELGELAQNVNTACSFMREVIDDAGYLLGEMANGNFRVGTKIEEKYVGNFVQLKEAMRTLNRDLSDTLKQINDGSDQVAVGSSQLAESAQSLAEGATEQASAIEELTAIVDNVNTLSAQNAEGSGESYRTVSAATKEAEMGRDDMNELVNAMNRISETSREIENIIGAIEDIASQTNLLSLNASIEAARAGEAGRGFAVVADQIGKLANDSAQSAVNTRELISASLQEIENGNGIMQKTAAVLEKIISDMGKFAELAKQSNESSVTESEMLGQVKSGIEQISSVVQSNSAVAEETSATSEELSAQSENLKMMVGKFQLR